MAIEFVKVDIGIFHNEMQRIANDIVNCRADLRDWLAGLFIFEICLAVQSHSLDISDSVGAIGMQ